MPDMFSVRAGEKGCSLGTRKKKILLLGQHGLLTDVLQQVLHKEDWEINSQTWGNKQWQERVRLQNPEDIVAFLGTQIRWEDLSQRLATADALLLLADKAPEQIEGAVKLPHREFPCDVPLRAVHPVHADGILNQCSCHIRPP